MEHVLEMYRRKASSEDLRLILDVYKRRKPEEVEDVQKRVQKKRPSEWRAFYVEVCKKYEEEPIKTEAHEELARVQEQLERTKRIEERFYFDCCAKFGETAK